MLIEPFEIRICLSMEVSFQEFILSETARPARRRGSVLEIRSSVRGRGPRWLRSAVDLLAAERSRAVGHQFFRQRACELIFVSQIKQL